MGRHEQRAEGDDQARPAEVVADVKGDRVLGQLARVARRRVRMPIRPVVVGGRAHARILRRSSL